jgi:hypothetical protein
MVWRRRRIPTLPGADIAAVAALTVLIALFFSPVLFMPGHWMPVGGGDLAGFLYPLYHYAADRLRAGHIPLWNPYLYCGSPFLADIQTAVFYPPNLLLALIPGGVTFRHLELLSIGHFWWAGVTMYLCLRGWECRGNHKGGPLARPAALLGAAAFALSDFFFTHFGNLNLIASASWLPLVLLGLRRGGRSGGLLGAMALAMSALAGHTQPLVYILMAIAFYTVFALGGALLQRPSAKSAEAVLPHRQALSMLYPPVFIVLVGLGLAALVLLPGFELTSLTRRATLSYTDATAYALPPAGLIGLVAPHLHGRGPDGFWADWPRVEVGYMGVLPLLLAAVGLRRGRRALFWAVLAGLALLLALGPATPLYRLVYDWVPGMSQLRAPARLVLLMDFGLAGLAALGLDALLRDPHPALGLPAAALAALLAIGLGLAWANLGAVGHPNPAQFAVAEHAMWGGMTLLALGSILIVLGAWGRLRAQALTAAALTLLAIDLLAQGVGVDVGTTDPTANYDHPVALAFLQADPSLYRVEVRSESWGDWAPNLSLLARIRDVAGIYNPLEVADYLLYWEGLTDRATRLYDFLNAKYVIGPKDFALPWGKFVPVFDADPTVNIYLNMQALPVVQVIYRSRVIPDSRAAFEALRADDFDPSREVILASGVTLEGTDREETQLSIAQYEPEAITVDVVTSDNAYVVFSEVDYPGWVATVDGQPTSIERANFAFRAVYVTAGAHRVALRFTPASWRLGLISSIMSALAWMGLAVTAAWRQRSGK